MMTIVVPCSDEDAALSVVRFASELAWPDAGPEVAKSQVNRLCMEAQEFIVMRKWLELASLMVTSAELIFSKVSEKEVEYIFTIICNHVTVNENPDEPRDITKVISAKIIQQPNEKPAVRLKIMMKDSFNFLTKYLETFSGEAAHVLSEAKEEAVHAVVEYVKAPDIFQCDLLDLPAVVQLEKDAKYDLVYQLLKIFLTHRLDSYLDFHAANSTLLIRYGLVHEECIAKMRLMSLVDPASYGSGQIPYELIRDTLRINDDEVELWVVKAITAKLIDGKMDQMNQVVIVSHHTDRVFGQLQWQTLRTRLPTWRGNIANVVSTIQANKITEDGSQAAQGSVVR